ncbi:uncharacterized protein FIBRA_06765 [Fibroporia radiculosa]|uniref:Uncharacterized protein n=1 Tax=Fibroporia radiculosa TaxID=599839 RepID=J4H491_9APHY|nr:uncharacterized protein FIBRA_06765 [Fibroporia radiculosa]CCM04584.1 predicted protein [Fibroporia radiculosa]
MVDSHNTEAAKGKLPVACNSLSANSTQSTAQEALDFLRQTCSACSAALQQPLAASHQGPSSTTLRRDFISLLTLLYTSTTKLALTLRPGEPAHRAALEPLRDLAANISALTTCSTLFACCGTTLASEARSFAKNVCEAVEVLAASFLEGGEDYLVRTGAVHDLIEKAKGDLSQDNCAAVRRRWVSDRGMLEDTYGEVTAMITDADAGGEDPDRYDFDDDELDELGLGSSKKMSVVELERTKKVQPLLRFTTLLHKRVQIDILSHRPVDLDSPDRSKGLDILPDHSHALLLASEELVAALYAPQDPATLSSAIPPLVESVHKLRDTLLEGDLLPPAQDSDQALATAISVLTVGGGSSKAQGKKSTDVRKWFETCFEQIDRVSKILYDDLRQEDPGTI